jgi:hypothetical protein
MEMLLKNVSSGDLGGWLECSRGYSVYGSLTMKNVKLEHGFQLIVGDY